MTHTQKIDGLLEDRGWPLRELARRTGFGRERIRRMTSQIPDSVLCAIRIAQVLNVSAEWLFDDEQDWPARPSYPPPASPASEEVDLLALRRELRKLLGVRP